MISQEIHNQFMKNQIKKEKKYADGLLKVYTNNGEEYLVEPQSLRTSKDITTVEKNISIKQYSEGGGGYLVAEIIKYTTPAGGCGKTTEYLWRNILTDNSVEGMKKFYNEVETEFAKENNKQELKIC